MVCLPSVLINEFYQLLLGVRLVWDGDRLLHERLVEVYLIQLQSQLFGHLKRIRGVSQVLQLLYTELFVCLFATYRLLKRGKEFNVGLEVLCSFFKCIII